MQYAGQTGSTLRIRLTETQKLNKLRRILFTITVSVITSGKSIPNKISTCRFKTILRRKIKIKWIRSLKTPYALGLMSIFSMTVIFQSCEVIISSLF